MKRPRDEPIDASIKKLRIRSQEETAFDAFRSEPEPNYERANAFLSRLHAERVHRKRWRNT